MLWDVVKNDCLDDWENDRVWLEDLVGEAALKDVDIVLEEKFFDLGRGWWGVKAIRL
jgi:hypothetical protein